MNHHNFRKLSVWQAGMEMVEACYRHTKVFPDEERFGLISQIQRCSVSIPANIAEGSAFPTPQAFKRYLHIAHGSCYELETHLLLANKLGFLADEAWEDLNEKLQQIQKMLFAFIRYIGSLDPKG